MFVKQFLFQIPCQNILGESVQWHEQHQALYWADIQQKQLHIWHHQNKQHQIIDLPYRLGSFSFTDHPHQILAAFEQGLAKYNYDTHEISWVSYIERENTHTRLNDGKCDPKGRFWIGSMVEQGDYNKLELEQQGALYCAHFDKIDHNAPLTHVEVEQALSGVHISNGLCFSADASVMYHTDSASHIVYRYELDEQGYIVDRSEFAKFDKHIYPDGACVDKHGNVWIALWGGACVVCFTSEGEELFKYPLPVTQATCPAIGGPDMNWLFVTTASDSLSQAQLEAQPRAGNVLVYELTESLGTPVTQLHLPD